MLLLPSATGCSLVLGSFVCTSTVPIDRVQSYVVEKFPDLYGMEVDRADCDSGGVLAILFYLAGGREEMFSTLENEDQCHFDATSDYWICTLDGQDDVYLEYATFGLASS